MNHYSVTLVCILVAFSYGCVPAEQEAWRQDVARVAAEVDWTVRDHPELPFRAWRLEDALGIPDFKGSSKELANTLSADDRKDDRMASLLRSFDRYTTGDYAQEWEGTSRAWTESDTFMACQVWVYDESRRFDRPVDHCLLCSDFGFMAVAFLVDEDRVIGVTTFNFWDPQAIPASITAAPAVPAQR